MLQASVVAVGASEGLVAPRCQGLYHLGGHLVPSHRITADDPRTGNCPSSLREHGDVGRAPDRQTFAYLILGLFPISSILADSGP